MSFLNTRLALILYFSKTVVTERQACKENGGQQSSSRRVRSNIFGFALVLFYIFIYIYIFLYIESYYFKSIFLMASLNKKESVTCMIIFSKQLSTTSSPFLVGGFCLQFPLLDLVPLFQGQGYCPCCSWF